LHYELAIVAFLENDPVKAAKSYESLLPFRNTIIGGTPPIDWISGALAQVVGKSDEASLHFEGAMAFCRKGSIPSRTGVDASRLRRHARGAGWRRWQRCSMRPRKSPPPWIYVPSWSVCYPKVTISRH